MALANENAGLDLRQIHPTWNRGLVAASIAVSLLGAFTSTQLMCQARVSRALLTTMTWTLLASLTFGFCSIWSLHFVAMLACELDVPIGLNAPLTVLSALLAVTFTFMALSSDFIIAKYQKQRRRKERLCRPIPATLEASATFMSSQNASSEHLLSSHDQDMLDRAQSEAGYTCGALQQDRPIDIGGGRAVLQQPLQLTQSHTPEMAILHGQHLHHPPFDKKLPGEEITMMRASVDSSRDDGGSMSRSGWIDSRRNSSMIWSDTSLAGLRNSMGLRVQKRTATDTQNPFAVLANSLWAGMTPKNAIKGLLWSFAITLMHYLGILSMEIKDGYFQLDRALVFCSAIISWIVCTIGCILMASMETNLGQQLLFTSVASSGVAAMHYTGMSATSFFTVIPPGKTSGYPQGLSVAIASIAIITCLVANGLLAHSATIARNKLAEIVRTRKKLWAAIAQKENAEAAALARSEFIASASHEIRTPLHQLQGYSDLLARCVLPKDAKLLLFAMQDATKSLSLITNNVLDWSRLERGEAVIRPTNLNMRSVLDSTIKLLPRRDDDSEVELVAVVSQHVPTNMFLDETCLSRIIMNLMSNALKFTLKGHVLLLVDLVDSKLKITVEDTGAGIPPSFLPNLFEPYKQAQIRGAERGTGLGLSIVRQLLDQVGGDIQVTSKHLSSDEVQVGDSGTRFEVSIPVPLDDRHDDGINMNFELSMIRQKLAVLASYTPSLWKGLEQAWSRLGVEIVALKSVPEVSAGYSYLWMDTRDIVENELLAQMLAERDDMTVLLACDTEHELQTALSPMYLSRFVVFKRPWILHDLLRLATEVQSQPPLSHDLLNRSVRFASQLDIVSANHKSDSTACAPQRSPSVFSVPPLLPGDSIMERPQQLNEQPNQNPMTVLLVEDNKINQRLGAKMLQTLGYNVLLANDGQEGVDMCSKHDREIDIILMDQSMPVKDGLTATKEIRELELTGVLRGPDTDRWPRRSHRAGVDHTPGVVTETRKRRRLIIAVTAVVGPSHEAMCKAVGSDAFLPKPLSLGRLKETLEKYTSFYGAGDEVR